MKSETPISVREFDTATETSLENQKPDIGV